MKKIFTIAAIAAATILAVSCTKEEEGGLQKKGITAHASLQPVEATKAIGEYSYNIVWEENDKIAVLDKDNNKASFKLTTGAGTTTGTFQQEGSDALTAPLTAYYPASVVAEDKSLSWPATQADVKSISNVPMTASSSTATGDVNFAFKHLGSVLQLVLTAKNGEINVKQIDITADQGLSGAFTVENGAAVISNTGTTISTGDISDKNIKLSATASYLNFAVPAGEFTNFKITITDTNDKEYSLSAKSLTLQRAMVNKVTYALDGKDPARLVFTVNGHTVTVKLHKGTPSSDVFLAAGINASDNSVNILSVAKSGRVLICLLDDGQTIEPVIDGNYYKFTISDVTKDITATLRYEYYKLKAFVYPSFSGNIISEYATEHQPGDNITLEVTSFGKLGDGGKFVGWKDKDGNLISEQKSINFDIESDAFPVAVFDVNYGSDVPLSGGFSVAADKGDGKPKKVRFSKGNLWYGKTNEEAVSPTFNFEDHQVYACSDKWNDNHVTLFFWSKDPAVTYQPNYSDPSGTLTDVLFTNTIDFAINGVNAWYTLSKVEWEYLLGDSADRYGKHKIDVSVDGNIGLVIAPDNFDGTIKDSYTTLDWDTAESIDGLVFLPAAGYRSNKYLYVVNSYGRYWSYEAGEAGEADDDDRVVYAYSFQFDKNTIRTKNSNRDLGFSVRLVTDYMDNTD